jgi:sialate O-acetylesterase
MRFRWSVAAAVVALGCGVAGADVTPASLFSDHMVVQQGMPVPVWGRATPGERVTVTLGGQSGSADAAADGKWMVRLGPVQPSATATRMTIAGRNTVVVNDVLVGEVWLGSGQSNMEFTVSKRVKSFAGVADEAAEIAAADHPLVRMFTVPMRMADQPQDDCGGHWEVCSPATAPAFSAVGYFFARDLQAAIGRPVGFINASYGASTAQAWVSRATLAADPQFAALLAAFDGSIAAWDAAHAGGRAPAASTQPRGRRAPKDPHQDQHNPTLLWNAMLHPVQPYAIRGAVWYQGESITGGTAQFTALTEAVITGWRHEWGEGDFPFYFVQLAALDNNSNRPEVRQAQAEVLRVPNTAMAVTIDIGDKKNVHPKDKQDVGDRLARIARANAYGERVEWSGPTVASARVDGSSVRVTFAHADGLTAKGGDPRTFEVAGADGKFVPAAARIDGATVVVSSPAVPQPAAVRYAWNRWPEGCNLYNGAGLPAGPFSTSPVGGP